MTSIALPIFDYAILALSTMVLIGLPIGLLLKRRASFDYLMIIIFVSLIIGAAIVMIEYVLLVEWCYSLERMPFGVSVSCGNFLPSIQFSALIGLVLAIVMVYFVIRR